MDCLINRTLFLRANGTFPCWCNAGAKIVLASSRPGIDHATDVFLGPEYRRIRRRLAADQVPFPDTCTHCDVFEPNKPFDPSHGQDRVVDLFHIETSMRCQLECPTCIPRRERPLALAPTEAGHLTLDPALLDKVLTDLRRAGVTVRTFFLQGGGDPLATPHVWRMIAGIRRFYPESFISVTTHACYDFRPEMVGAGLSELICSIDGVDQESYAKFRVGGSFDRAYRFMADFAAAGRSAGRPFRVVWKYILFEHNDSDEQLLRAQALARDAGVSELVFVVTFWGPASRRVFEAEDTPLLPGGAPTRTITAAAGTLADLEQRLLALKHDVDRGANDRIRQDTEYVGTKLLQFCSVGVVSGRRRAQLLRMRDLTFPLLAVAPTLTPADRDRIVTLHDGIVRRLAKGTDFGADRFFDESFYLTSNPDVAAAVARAEYLDGFDHFAMFGAAEGRAPSAGPLQPGTATPSVILAVAATVLRDVEERLAAIREGIGFVALDRLGETAAYAAAALHGLFHTVPISRGYRGRLQRLWDVVVRLVEWPVLPRVVFGRIVLLHDVIARLLSTGSSPAADLVFDDAAYLAKYRDVDEAVRQGRFDDGFDHFAQYGSAEGRRWTAGPPAPKRPPFEGGTPATARATDVSDGRGPAAFGLRPS